MRFQVWPRVCVCVCVCVWSLVLLPDRCTSAHSWAEHDCDGVLWFADWGGDFLIVKCRSWRKREREREREREKKKERERETDRERERDRVGVFSSSLSSLVVYFYRGYSLSTVKPLILASGEHEHLVLSIGTGKKVTRHYWQEGQREVCSMYEWDGMSNMCSLPTHQNCI